MIPYQYCERCRRVSENIEVWRIIKANNDSLCFYMCMEQFEPHRTRRDARNITHAEVRDLGLKVEELHVLYNNISATCAVYGCQEPGVENHHWAPIAEFGKEEAELWPKSDLCRKHHVGWHNKMRKK